MILSTIKVSKEKFNLIVKSEIRVEEQGIIRFLGGFGAGYGGFKQQWLSFHWDGYYPKCLPKSKELLRKVAD